MTGARAVPPDTKDWTWVLERRCLECGHDAGSMHPDDVGGLALLVAVAWRRRLSSGSAASLLQRPQPARWSVLEYGCHVRDVYRHTEERIRRMLVEDDPRFENWDQDASAVADCYDQQGPSAVADEVTDAAGLLAALLLRTPATSWARPGTRSDGARFSVASLAQYFLHDPLHHLADVGSPVPQLQWRAA